MGSDATQKKRDKKIKEPFYFPFYCDTKAALVPKKTTLNVINCYLTFLIYLLLLTLLVVDDKLIINNRFKTPQELSKERKRQLRLTTEQKRRTRNLEAKIPEMDPNRT